MKKKRKRKIKEDILLKGMLETAIEKAEKPDRLAVGKAVLYRKVEQAQRSLDRTRMRLRAVELVERLYAIALRYDRRYRKSETSEPDYQI